LCVAFPAIPTVDFERNHNTVANQSERKKLKADLPQYRIETREKICLWRGISFKAEKIYVPVKAINVVA
jgi:hypothetical protein